MRGQNGSAFAPPPESLSGRVPSHPRSVSLGLIVDRDSVSNPRPPPLRTGSFCPLTRWDLRTYLAANVPRPRFCPPWLQTPPLSVPPGGLGSRQSLPSTSRMRCLRPAPPFFGKPRAPGPLAPPLTFFALALTRKVDPSMGTRCPCPFSGGPDGPGLRMTLSA